MSYKCYVCGKGSSSGNTVSHSNKASKRLFRPNLQELRIVVNGKKTREYVCTSCIRSGKIQKVKKQLLIFESCFFVVLTKKFLYYQMFFLCSRKYFLILFLA